MADFTCDVNELLSNSRCFLEQCASEDDREAIELYARVQNLAASGGADYRDDLNALLTAAKEFQVLAKTQRKSIDLWIDIQNAIDNGASFEQDINSLKAAAKCYQCLGVETKRNVLTYLKCAINQLGVPD